MAPVCGDGGSGSDPPRDAAAAMRMVSTPYLRDAPPAEDDSDEPPPRGGPAGGAAVEDVVRRLTGALARWAADGGWEPAGVHRGVETWTGLGDPDGWVGARGEAVLPCAPDAAKV